MFWGVPCQFEISKDISHKEKTTTSLCQEKTDSLQHLQRSLVLRSSVAAMAADQGGDVQPPGANISTKKILETIASLLATKDPWGGPKG